MTTNKTQKLQLGYTTIMHDPRLQFKLSNNEYCIADAIYHLSHNPDGAVIGWCYASRQTIGSFFGLSRQTVITALKRLADKKLIEINIETGYIKTTQTWYQNFVMYKLQTRKYKL